MNISFRVISFLLIAFTLMLSVNAAVFEDRFGISVNTVNTSADSGSGIKENIPAEFLDRYVKWKTELLSTDFGRSQWELYSDNDHFLLKITVDSDRKFGASTGDFKWNDKGELIGATITLGKNLDKGFPDPVYYPVMNSLSLLPDSVEAKGSLLASTKFAHELGHVDLTSRIDGKTIQQQDKLMNAYYKIFLSNGYNTNDPRLTSLVATLGRQPIEIWEDREYWGEANAMRFLASRSKKGSSICSLLGNIMRNVDTYAKSYEDRFDQIVESSVPNGCR